MTASAPGRITGERLTSLFRPRSVALVGASDKSTFSLLANQVSSCFSLKMILLPTR